MVLCYYRALSCAAQLTLSLLMNHLNQSISSLSKLANARFEQEGDIIDLDEAISLHRQALELRLPNPNGPDSLNDLGIALLTRFEQGGQKIDLDEAIFLHRQALELRAPPHPNQHDSLNASALACALSTRFEHEGQQVD